MTAAAEILELARAYFGVAFVVFLRVGTAILVLPILGEALLPVRVRLTLALALTAAVTPAVAADLGGTLAAHHFLTEPIAGLILGLALRLVVHALQTAGSIAAQTTSLSQFAPTVMPDPQPAMAGLLWISGLTLAVILDAHVLAVEMLVRSYGVLPAGLVPPGGDLARWGVAAVAGSFALAFRLAAPFCLAAVVYNVALGVINRAMPSLMVAFVGAPAITLGGLALLFAAAPLLLPVWAETLGAVLAAPFAP